MFSVKSEPRARPVEAEEKDEEEREEREEIMKATEIKAEMLQLEEAFTAAWEAGIDVRGVSNEEVLRMMTSRWTRKPTPKKPLEQQDVVEVTGSQGKGKGKGKTSAGKMKGKCKKSKGAESADPVPEEPVPDPVPVEEQQKEQKEKPKKQVAKKRTSKPHHVRAVADVHVDSEQGQASKPAQQFKVQPDDPSYLVQAKYNVSRMKVDKKKEMRTSKASISVITPTGSAQKEPVDKEPNVIYEVVRKLDTSTTLSSSTEDSNGEGSYSELCKKILQSHKGATQPELRAFLEKKAGIDPDLQPEQREAVHAEFQKAQQEFRKMMSVEAAKKRLFSQGGEEAVPPRKRSRKQATPMKKLSPLDKMWANLKQEPADDDDDDDDDLELEDAESKCIL